MACSPGRITYHSPVTCPACGSTFQGTFTDRAAKQNQACPECGQTWLSAWAGWTLSADRHGGRHIPLHDRDGLPGGRHAEALAS